jgi:hypothetical protein
MLKAKPGSEVDRFTTEIVESLRAPLWEHHDDTIRRVLRLHVSYDDLVLAFSDAFHAGDARDCTHLQRLHDIRRGYI